jgi:hypothetical protein
MSGKTLRQPSDMVLLRTRELQKWKKWVSDHGLTQAGYVEYHGDPGLNVHYTGEGGSALFCYDVSELAQRIGRLKKALGRPGHAFKIQDMEEALLFARDVSWLDPKWIVKDQLRTYLRREPTDEEVEMALALKITPGACIEQ